MTDTGQEAGSGRAQLVKLLVDIGPLAVFFLVNAWYGIFWATAAFMVATVASAVASRMLYGKIAAMPLVTGAFVLVFGGLTLYLQDETFIKIKPTVIYMLFAGLLLVALALDRLFLKMLLGEVFEMTDAGWRKLTTRWAGFFVFLALLNEVVWRNVSTDVWVSFKVFGLLPLTFVFAALQVSLLQKHMKGSE